MALQTAETLCHLEEFFCQTAGFLRQVAESFCWRTLNAVTVKK
jgi:hypothetical protein